MAIINMFTNKMQGSTLDVRIKPHAVRFKYFGGSYGSGHLVLMRASLHDSIIMTMYNYCEHICLA